MNFNKSLIIVSCCLGIFVLNKHMINNNDKFVARFFDMSAYSNDSSIEDEAKQSVKKRYGEIMGIMKISDKSQRDSQLKQFFKDHFDVGKISKNLCGVEDRDVIESLSNMLVRLYTTDTMIDILSKYEIKDDMKVETYDKSIQVSCLVFSRKDNKEVSLIVIFSNDSSKLGKLLDFKVENVSIISGSKTQISSYIEGKYHKSIKSIKDEKERAKLVAEALNSNNG